MEVSAKVKEEINQIIVEKPHVVILGASASYGAFPHGTKHGRKLPLMNNLVETLGLQVKSKNRSKFGPGYILTATASFEPC
jgi:hypothetical protein